MKNFMSLLVLIALVLVVWFFVLPVLGLLIRIIITAVIVIAAIAIFNHIKSGGNKV
jgi:hypothetical protein